VRDAVRNSAFPLAVAGAMTLVAIILLGSVLARPYPTIVTGGNNDVAAYAVLSQHIADDGIDDPGPIVGADIGNRAQSDFDFGIMAVSAAASTMGPFRDVWRYQLPLLAIAVGSLSFAIARLLDVVAPGRRLLTVLAAVAGTSTFLTTYLWSEYFLNQLVAMTLMVAAGTAVARATDEPTLRTTAGFAVASSILMVPLIASYPHLGVIGSAMIVPPMLLAAGRHALPRRALRALAVGAAVAAGSALLIPTPFLNVVDSLRYLDTIDAGWPLPGFLPSEVLGFVNTEKPRHDSITEWIPSVVLLTVVLAAAVALVRRRVAPGAGYFTVTFVPLALLSHAVIYLREGGPTYQQWKWLTSFVPLIAAACVFTLLLGWHRTGGGARREQPGGRVRTRRSGAGGRHRTGHRCAAGPPCAAVARRRRHRRRPVLGDDVDVVLHARHPGPAPGPAVVLPLVDGADRVDRAVDGPPGARRCGPRHRAERLVSSRAPCSGLSPPPPCRAPANR
jgi:hypothetical protein